jgi:hypothetical protein
MKRPPVVITRASAVVAEDGMAKGADIAREAVAVAGVTRGAQAAVVATTGRAEDRRKSGGIAATAAIAMSDRVMTIEAIAKRDRVTTTVASMKMPSARRAILGDTIGNRIGMKRRWSRPRLGETSRCPLTKISAVWMNARNCRVSMRMMSLPQPMVGVTKRPVLRAGDAGAAVAVA